MSESSEHLLKLFDHKKAALILGCSTNTLKQSRVTGVLFGKPAPLYEKHGRKVLYREDRLQEFNKQFLEQSNTTAA